MLTPTAFWPSRLIGGWDLGYSSVTVALFLGLIVLLVAIRKRRRLDLDSMPSATLSDVLLLCLDSRRAHEWFRQCHEKYGPIFRVRLFYREIVLVADTQVAQQVLTSGPLYLPQKSFEYSAIDPVRCTFLMLGDSPTKVTAEVTLAVYTGAYVWVQHCYVLLPGD
jgi:hypothetical protein